MAEKPTNSRLIGGYHDWLPLACLDVSMLGVEKVPRVYEEIFPTLSARDYKDPRLIIGVRKK